MSSEKLPPESSQKEEGEGGDVITLRVRDQTGDEMFFKVKKTTKMNKIFDAYAARRGITSNALRFMLDGERITADNTPKMLELEDNEQIDVMLETVGGMAKKRKKKTYTKPKKGKHHHKNVKLAVLKFYQVDEDGKVSRSRKDCPQEQCG
jgi:ubiquitin